MEATWPIGCYYDYWLVAITTAVMFGVCSFVQKVLLQLGSIGGDCWNKYLGACNEGKCFYQSYVRIMNAFVGDLPWIWDSPLVFVLLFSFWLLSPLHSTLCWVLFFYCGFIALHHVSTIGKITAAHNSEEQFHSIYKQKYKLHEQIIWTWYTNSKSK